MRSETPGTGLPLLSEDVLQGPQRGVGVPPTPNDSPCCPDTARVPRPEPGTFQVTNQVGRRFEVRCIGKGTRYGLNDCLLHDRDDPLIEFTDVTPPGGLAPVAEPGFVARFPAAAFLGRGGADVWLFGRDVAWRLSPEQVRQVTEWIQALLESGS